MASKLILLPFAAAAALAFTGCGLISNPNGPDPSAFIPAQGVGTLPIGSTGCSEHVFCAPGQGQTVVCKAGTCAVGSCASNGQACKSASDCCGSSSVACTNGVCAGR